MQTFHYKVLMFAVSDLHKMEKGLNEHAQMGYRAINVAQDSSGRYIVVMEAPDMDLPKAKKSAE